MEFDAKMEPISMPKLVTEKIMETIKKHVSLNGKIIQIHSKNKNEGLASCGRERKRYQTNIKKDTKFYLK